MKTNKIFLLSLIATLSVYIFAYGNTVKTSQDKLIHIAFLNKDNKVVKTFDIENNKNLEFNNFVDNKYVASVTTENTKLTSINYKKVQTGNEININFMPNNQIELKMKWIGNLKMNHLTGSDATTKIIDLPSVDMASLDEVIPIPNHGQSIYELKGSNNKNKMSVIISTSK